MAAPGSGHARRHRAPRQAGVSAGLPPGSGRRPPRPGRAAATALRGHGAGTVAPVLSQVFPDQELPEALLLKYATAPYWPLLG